MRYGDFSSPDPFPLFLHNSRGYSLVVERSLCTTRARARFARGPGFDLPCLQNCFACCPCPQNCSPDVTSMAVMFFCEMPSRHDTKTAPNISNARQLALIAPVHRSVSSDTRCAPPLRVQSRQPQNPKPQTLDVRSQLAPRQRYRAGSSGGFLRRVSPAEEAAEKVAREAG